MSDFKSSVRKEPTMYMKVAVISTGPKLDDPIGARPDKCPYWLLVDPVTMEYEAIPNPLMSISGPAKEMFIVQILQKNRVKFILAGSYGVDHLNELGKNGIKVLLGLTGSVRETVGKFNRSIFSGQSEFC